MPKKHMTVRLRCSLDNGKTTWSPGDCVSLPEDQALSLLEMGLAERVDESETKKPASTPRAKEPPAPEQLPQSEAAQEEYAGQSDESAPENGDGSEEESAPKDGAKESAEAQSPEGENNG